MRITFHNHDLQTARRGDFLDVTDDLVAAIEDSGVRDGMALVYSPHTTCAVVINEQESGFQADFQELMDTLAPPDDYYRHDDDELRTENLEDPHDVPNGHAHCRGGLLSSSSEAIPIRSGRLQLGRWQRVFLVELDRPRDRKVYVQVMGE